MIRGHLLKNGAPGYFPGKIDGIAASVKDTKRFGGDRYGWGYFNFGMDKKTAAVEAPENCNACHKQNAAEDMTFTQYYPVLRAAKPMGMMMKPGEKMEGMGGSSY